VSRHWESHGTGETPDFVTPADAVAEAVKNGKLTPAEAAAIEALFAEHADENGHI
jgi:hypothetical protein